MLLIEALPVINRSLTELRQRELGPFVAAIDAGVRAVMTSHILLPQIDSENPATTSRVLLVALLREDLGLSGLIVSDALDIAGAQQGGGFGDVAVRALHAGCDLLCLGTDNTDDDLAEIERVVRAATRSEDLNAERLQDGTDRRCSTSCRPR